MSNSYQSCPKARYFLTTLLSLFLMGWLANAYSHDCGCAKATLFYRLQLAIANDLDEKTGMLNPPLKNKSTPYFNFWNKQDCKKNSQAMLSYGRAPETFFALGKHYRS